ncbi:MAG: methyltransferase domain-containing protein [Nitrospirota bacterium]|nr:methyltransferase domain-containing protein [Nitrospirota bacterium]
MNSQARPQPATPPSMDTIKAKMKATWMDGDYVAFARFMEPGAIEILNSWNIAPGEKLLDLGCGAGQIAIPAARKGVDVTGVDIAANLIEHANGRARSEGLKSARFEEGDAESLPHADASFDVVTSLIGAMFAPQPDKVASEMARVCRPGGRVRMANWTPQGFVGQFFKALVRHVQPPAGVPSVFLWGDEETVKTRLGKHFSKITLTRKHYPNWTYPFDTPEVVELFRNYYGPIKRAFDSLDAAGQAALRKDLEEVYAAHNEATDGTTRIRGGEFLDIHAVRA